MMHYVIELALWTLLAFMIGCVLGAAGRRASGKDSGGAASLSDKS